MPFPSSREGGLGGEACYSCPCGLTASAPSGYIRPRGLTASVPSAHVQQPHVVRSVMLALMFTFRGWWAEMQGLSKADENVQVVGQFA